MDSTESGHTLLTNNRGQPRYLILQIHLNMVTCYTPVCEHTYISSLKTHKITPRPKILFGKVFHKNTHFDRLPKITITKIGFLKWLFLWKLIILMKNLEFWHRWNSRSTCIYVCIVYGMSCSNCPNIHTQVPLIIF